MSTQENPPKTEPTKQEFVQWMLDNLPGINDYFSTTKLNQWSNNIIGSSEYDNWFNQYKTGDREALKNSLIGRLTGMNPAYASYMAKAKNSGAMIRAEIAIIQNELNQTDNQITMWKAIEKSPTSDSMLAFAQSLLDSYTRQRKQVADTLQKYQSDLDSGIKSGIYT